MFKPGDRVVCIDNITRISGIPDDLTINKTYIVLNSIESPLYNEDLGRVIILDDRRITNSYFSYRFISVREYRKRKLEKLCMM